MAKNIYDLTEQERELYWKRLQELLQKTPLACQGTTTRRIANADEFMMMHVDDRGCVGFKHRDTRNYVFLVPGVPTAAVKPELMELYVPCKPEPFMRGFFNSCEPMVADTDNYPGVDIRL